MKKLLITLGDSFTKGVGSYSEESLNRYNNKQISDTELRIINQKRFEEYSWPVQLSKKINYDVINLAESGMANSSMARALIQEKYTRLKDVYEEVLVISLLVSPSRFGHFSNGLPVGMVNNPKDIMQQKFFEGLFHHMKTPEIDLMMETAFSLRCIELFCKHYNYEFLYGSLWGLSINELNKFYKSDNSLHIYLDDEMLLHNSSFLKEYFAFCGHLNERGYEKLADIIFKIIKEKRIVLSQSARVI